MQNRQPNFQKGVSESWQGVVESNLGILETCQAEGIDHVSRDLEMSDRQGGICSDGPAVDDVYGT